MDLMQLGEDLSFGVAFEVQGLADKPIGSAAHGSLVQSLILKTQALANLVLLAKGDTNKFHHNHIRASILRRDFLASLRDSGLDDVYHQCAGRIAGLLSGITSRSWGLVTEIIRLTPNKFRERMEYEDDFLFAAALMRLADKDSAPLTMDQVRQRTEDVDIGAMAARFDAVFAIDYQDAIRFDESFREVIFNRAEEIEGDKQRGQLEEADVIGHRLVFTEGMALLSLAQRHGVSTDDEYRFCPSLGRAEMTKTFIPDL